ncbi:NAD-dependent epimerase/dehydratase family protein [Marinicella sp. W31]|uniref:NAD-dependent epimerase/dehydratase family protein n=1 Tax=Marinicella sp. W31 TaxID=3023713 RepID=UPI003756AC53
MSILVTGAAGFIGHEVCLKLLQQGEHVIGVDNINSYYDVQLKQDRLQRLQHDNFQFHERDICEHDWLMGLFSDQNIQQVVHLAAQAGVRYSITNPWDYNHSNLDGFLSILECCRAHPVEHLLYASSSSVYGSSGELPSVESAETNKPMSLYAATKKANELMAHAYANLYRIPTTGLRFFTVYGPWGRPDMAFFSFTEKILKDEPIEVFNYGKHTRDFTFVDDIIEGILRVLKQAPEAAETTPTRVFNIGNSQSVELMDYIAALEKALDKKAQLIMKPLQKGDVMDTLADVSALDAAVGFKPCTPVDVGIARFVDWYKSYYGATA